MNPPSSATLPEALQERLLTLSFSAYEECVRELLLSMGYLDVRLFGRTSSGQKTKHGGLDAKAYTETGVTRVYVIAQMKQYTLPVPRRYIDELRGTMLRTGARQGILLTTSTFSPSAKRAAAGDNSAPIRLIEGEELSSLLIQNRIGVKQDSENGLTIDIPRFERLREQFPGEPQTRQGMGVRKEVATLSRFSSLAVVPTQFPNETTMLSRTHILIGVCTLWGLSLIPEAITRDSVALLAGVATFGALLPDLDAAESKIKSLSVKGVRPFAPFADLAYQTWGHRGFLHSPLALGILGIALIPLTFWVDWQIPLALWLGYGSHLAADACTRTGIPGAPFTKRLFLLPKRWRFLTGSPQEDMLFPLLASAVMFLLLRYLFAQ